MEKDSSTIGKYALVVVIAGMSVFILSDLGLFTSLQNFFNEQTAKRKQQIQSPEDSLLVYSGKLKEELQKIEDSLAQEKIILRSVQAEITRSQAELKRKKQTIKNLENEIASLSKLKDTLIQAQNPRNLASAEKLLSMTSKKGNDLWSAPPASIDALAEKLSERSGGTMSAETITVEGRSMLRLSGQLGFSQTNGIYLTAETLRNVALFSEGAAKMKYNQFILAYNNNDALILERLQVIAGFLRERLGGEIFVTRKKMDQAALSLTDNLEIWVSNEGTL
jgi:hypothetical protein